MENNRLLSTKQVCQITSVSRTSLWKLVTSGAFPKPVKVTPNGNRVAYVESEVLEWIGGRIAERDREAAA